MSKRLSKSVLWFLVVFVPGWAPTHTVARVDAQTINGPEALTHHLMDIAIAGLRSDAEKHGLTLRMSDSTRLELENVFAEGAQKIPWDKGDSAEIARQVRLSEENTLVIARAVEATAVKTGARGGSGKGPELLVSKASVKRALAPAARGQKRGICPGLFPFC